MSKASFLAAIATSVAVLGVTVATPAHAEAPQGPRAEVIVGWDKVGGQSQFNESGVTYGVGLGYDFDISNRSSLGIDAEATTSTADETSSLGQNETLKMEAKRDLYIGGRYTYAASDKVNLFATAGYSNLRIGAESSLGQSDNVNLDGIRLGAGVQYNLTDKLYWTSSYRYTNYQDGLNRNQVVTGIGYRF